MVKVIILDTEEVKSVENNVAHALIEQGKAMLYSVWLEQKKKTRMMTPETSKSKYKTK